MFYNINNMLVINSLNNPKVKELTRLYRASDRRARGVFLVDGEREISAAVCAGWEIQSLFFCPKLIGKLKNNFFALRQEAIIEVSEMVFKKICYKEKPDGFLALIKIKKTSLADFRAGKNPLIIVLENVEKPGNLGAIIRTAYAAQVDAIIINDNQTDIYNPNTIRASEGLIFSQPIFLAGLEETKKWLKDQKIKSLAAATIAKKNYSALDLRSGSALVFGSEARGLSRDWLKSADQLIKIPMRAGVDSLNVSVSVAVVSYEALRQRQVKT